MKLRNVALAILVSLLCGGCAQTYVVRPDPVASINVYTPDRNKIPGKWIYVLDDSVGAARREIKASSRACSLHMYQVEGGDAFSSYVRNAMESLFETTTQGTAIPSADNARTESLRGALVFRVDEFLPRFNCSVGPAEGYCTATTDLAIQATLVDFKTSQRRSINSSSQRTSDGGSGRLCDSVVNVLSESVRKAIRDALERFGERAAAGITDGPPK
jgi:hypothetical protein